MRCAVFGIARLLASQLATANDRLHEAYQTIASMKREGYEPVPLAVPREPAKRLPVVIQTAIDTATLAGSKERSDAEAYAWSQLVKPDVALGAASLKDGEWSKAVIDAVAQRILRGPEMPGGVNL
jgi:hypothetical protein